MFRLLLGLIAVVVLVVGAGVLWLGTRDMPPPTKQVEKIIPNDRFSR